MEQAIEEASAGVDLTVASVEAVHRTLMVDEPERVSAGRFRDEQDWIGGRRSNPSDAQYIPPPEDRVPAFMADLVDFVNREDLPAVAQAAIAHAQFETIHPFVDGNGRVGRCLIHVVLRRRDVARSFVPPVSIVLAARPEAYVSGLVDFREGRLESWCAAFAGASRYAAESSADLAARVAALQSDWRERRTATPGLGRCPHHRRPAGAADRLRRHHPRRHRGAPSASTRRTQGTRRRRCPAADQRRDLRPPIRGGRAVRADRGP